MITVSIGFGAIGSNINFYIANRPPISDYPHLTMVRGLGAGEVAHIVENTSNHWRKAFNVYAKLLFNWYRLKNECQTKNRNDLPISWQEYRDVELFQSHSKEALMFSAPELNRDETIHIIAGKTYAARLDLPPLVWLDSYFAINEEYKLIVAPYPDYRQLSNQRIAQLIELMNFLR